MSTAKISKNQIKRTFSLVLLLIGLTILVIVPSSSGSRPVPLAFANRNSSSTQVDRSEFRQQRRQPSNAISYHFPSTVSDTEPIDLSAGLIGHWSLDGNADDISGNGHNGTISGATPITTGKCGGSHNFNGSASIDVGNLDFSSEQYTVSSWIRTALPAVTESWKDWLTKLDIPSGTGPFMLFLGDGRAVGGGGNGPGLAVWKNGAGPVDLYGANLNYRDGNWHHVAVTYQNGSQKLYADGVLMYSSAYPGPLPSNSSSVVIGGIEGFGPYHHRWVGDIDEVWIHNRVLNSSEILALKNLYSTTSGFPVSGNNWSMNAEISDNDGLVLHNVMLGSRYMAEKISLPYYNLETSSFPKKRLQLKPCSDDEDGRSQLVDFKVLPPANNNPLIPLRIMATYKVDNVPKGSKSSVSVTQQYEFYGEIDDATSPNPCEPSGDFYASWKLSSLTVRFGQLLGALEQRNPLPCSRFKPIVKYQFLGKEGEALKSINLAQRLYFKDQNIAPNTAVLSHNCEPGEAGQVVLDGKGNVIAGEPCYYPCFRSDLLKLSLCSNPPDSPFAITNLLLPAPGLSLKNDETALGREVLIDAITNGQKGDYDDFHQTYKSSVDLPIPIPPGAEEAVHMHWRWAKYFGDNFGNGTIGGAGKPMIPAGSNQDVQIALVAATRAEDPDNFKDFFSGEPESLRNQSLVFWYSATGKQNEDQFFTHGGFFSSHISPKGSADLKLIQSASQRAVKEGNNLGALGVEHSLTYTLSVSNLGPDSATGVSLYDGLPAGVSFVSATSSQGTCTEKDGFVTCDLGSLAKDAQATATIVVKLTANSIKHEEDGTVINLALAISNEADPNSDNNLVGQNTTSEAPTTALISSVNPSDSGQSVTFTATVTSEAGTPPGTVQFKDNGTNMGSAIALNSSGIATFATSVLTSGIHTITADYGGDPNFLTSTGTLAGGQVVKAQPSLSVNDVSMAEADTGAKTLNFTVTLSSQSSLAVNVNFATANGTATAPSDYSATNGTLTLNPGDLTKTVGVTINGDESFEPDETFTVNLSNAVNAIITDNQGVATILNDDTQGGLISFSQQSYSVSESAGFVNITVNRTNDTSRAATVDYATNDSGAPGSCSTINGLASERCGFTTAMGTLKFAPGETQKTFSVLVNRDSYLEGPEMFMVNLSNPTGGAAFMTPSSATVTITDSPTGPPSNLIDDASILVRQHYHDLLNRDPDAEGLAFWINEITSCGSNAACIDNKRINVSVAFFLSIEFQETGGAAYLANKAAFGAVPSYNRFERDSQALGRDYVFTATGSAAVLEANRVAYFSDFVNRPEFISIYGFLFNGQYVDALIANTAVSFTQTERDALVNGMNLGTETQATVLRKISEKQSFRQAEANRMFVLMEYFAYLRRDPDLAGFSFWLNKLNKFNGNYLDAEMVKAFLLSAEYRNRFGP